MNSTWAIGHDARELQAQLIARHKFLGQSEYRAASNKALLAFFEQRKLGQGPNVAAWPIIAAHS
jgi:hypothetical protein